MATWPPLAAPLYKTSFERFAISSNVADFYDARFLLL